jgi:hypothetical protein
MQELRQEMAQYRRYTGLLMEWVAAHDQNMAGPLDLQLRRIWNVKHKATITLEVVKLSF